MNKNIIEIAKIMKNKFDSDLQIIEEQSRKTILFDNTTIGDYQFEIHIKTDNITGEFIEADVCSNRACTTRLCQPGRKRTEGIDDFVLLKKFKNINEIEEEIEEMVEKFMLENETYRISTQNLLWLEYGNNLHNMLRDVNVSWSWGKKIDLDNNVYFLILQSEKVSVDIPLYLDSTQIKVMIEKFKNDITREKEFEKMINKKTLFGWFL